MYLDAHQVFSSEQTLTPIAASTVASTNVIDFGDGSTTDADGSLELGGGEPVRLVIRIVDAVTTGGTTYVQFQLLTDYAVAFGGSAVSIAETYAIGTAVLVAGYEITLSFLPDQVERYLRVNYIISGNDTTAGSVDAFLVIDRQAGETATA